jgi:hypothetical protein
MADLKIGYRVTTETKFNKKGFGTGVIIGVEVPDGERSGHLRHETDPLLANALLAQMGDEDTHWHRIVVDCFDPDGSIQEMYGSTILCFYESDKVSKLWHILGNGEDYMLDNVIEGIEYWIPNDETYTIRVKHIETGLEKDTEFFEMDDFEHEDSDYAYVMHNGELMCRFEAED